MEFQATGSGRPIDLILNLKVEVILSDLASRLCEEDSLINHLELCSKFGAQKTILPEKRRSTFAFQEPPQTTSNYIRYLCRSRMLLRTNSW